MSACTLPEQIPDVRSLSDAARWLEHSLAVLLRSVEDDQRKLAVLKRMSKCMQRLTLSTAFSGTGGPENALNSIAHGLKHFTGCKETRQPRPMFAVNTSVCHCAPDPLRLRRFTDEFTLFAHGSETQGVLCHERLAIAIRGMLRWKSSRTARWSSRCPRTRRLMSLLISPTAWPRTAGVYYGKMQAA